MEIFKKISAYFDIILINDIIFITYLYRMVMMFHQVFFELYVYLCTYEYMYHRNFPKIFPISILKTRVKGDILFELITRRLVQVDVR